MTTPPDQVLSKGTEEGSVPALRCRIMAVAERLFRDIGYRKTTLADIGAEIGMSPGNVYRFFASKKALNEAVADRLLGDLAAELDRIAGDTDRSPSERLRSFIVAMHEMSAQQFVVDRRMHEMVEAAMSESWQVIHHHIVRVDEILIRLAKDGITAGDFAPQDPIVAAHCVHSAILRFCHPALIAQCADEPGPSIDQMVDFLLAALRYGGPGQVRMR